MLCTNGRDGLHELILFQLEEDGGFPSSVQPQCHHPDLHLWTNMHPVVLKPKRTHQLSRTLGCFWQDSRLSWHSVYLSEGDRDAGIQLDVVCQFSELMLLLLKRLQQTVDLLLCQHDSAVVLQQERSIRHGACRFSCM